MKIYVLGSTSFMKEMVEAKNQLCALGFDGWIHPHYEAFVHGEKKEHLVRWENANEPRSSARTIISMSITNTSLRVTLF